MSSFFSMTAAPKGVYRPGASGLGREALGRRVFPMVVARNSPRDGARSSDVSPDASVGSMPFGNARRAEGGRIAVRRARHGERRTAGVVRHEMRLQRATGLDSSHGICLGLSMSMNGWVAPTSAIRSADLT